MKKLFLGGVLLLSNTSWAIAADLAVSSTAGLPGANVTVNLSFIGDGALAAAQYTLAYDPTTLTPTLTNCVSGAPGNLTPTCVLDSANDGADPDQIVITFGNVPPTTTLVSASAFGSIDFAIDSGAAVGSEPLNLDNTGTAGVCTNANLAAGNCISTDGTITIQGTLRGTLTPNPVPLGSETINITTAPQDATLTNDGSDDLIVNGAVSLPNNPSGVFAINTNNCTNPTNLGINETCTVSVECTPLAAILYDGTLRIATNAGNIDTALRCTGLAPNGIISAIDFGTEMVGVTSTAEDSTVTSRGPGDLMVSGAASLPTNPGNAFAITNDACNGQDLGTSGTCTVSVTCTLGTPGLINGTLRVPTNAGNLDAALSCNGIAPNPSVSPSPLTLQAPLGDPAFDFVTLSNNGTADLNGISPSVSGPFAIDSNNCSSSLAPSSNCTMDLSCTVSDTLQTGTLTLDFSNASSLPVNLRCTEQQFEMTAIPTLSQWGGILMAGLLGLFTWAANRRHQQGQC